MEIELAKHIFEVTKTFPTSEKYKLISQMNRCCVSIASKIAETLNRSNKSFYH